MLILASSSPRRYDLLSRLHIPFEIHPSRLPERQPHAGEDPHEYALLLARQKAEDVARRYAEATVLAADTVVVVDGTILGKPSSPDDGLRMLHLLCGRTHHVITGVAVRCGPTERFGWVRAEVQMRQFGPEEAEQYVATGEPIDKAGAYAVQGMGGDFVEQVRGCYETVVGLPLCLTRDLLAQCGVTNPDVSGLLCTHPGS